MDNIKVDKDIKLNNLDSLEREINEKLYKQLYKELFINLYNIFDIELDNALRNKLDI